MGIEKHKTNKENNRNIKEEESLQELNSNVLPFLFPICSSLGYSQIAPEKSKIHEVWKRYFKT